MANVLLVHGLYGSPATFTAMKAGLESAGHAVAAPQLPGQECVANSQFLGRVMSGDYYLLGYSLGGLAARFALKCGPYNANIKGFISLDVPHHGIWWATGFPESGGGEAGLNDQFTNFLNWAPEPGIRTLCIVNSHPTGMGDSGLLPNATIQRVNMDHGSLPSNASIISSVASFIT